MNPFADEEEKIFEAFEHIFEMANVDPEDHRFGVPLKMHILQPGDKWPGHGPRVKFFKKNPERDGFSVTLHPDSAKIYIVDRKKEQVATEAEENVLLRKVQRYRVPLWNMYFDPYMSQREMLNEMADIDAGREVTLRGGRHRKAI